MCKLSILIATTIDRREMFEVLYQNFQLQIELGQFQDAVEIIWLEDDKQISIGLKRQQLLELAKGEYIVFFDSDDEPFSYYVSEIMQALSSNPDCVGMEIAMSTNGKNSQLCCHSLEYPEWKGDGKTKIDGYDYVRNVTHFNPVRRELALRAGFPDLRFGEDHVYSNRVTALCSVQVMIKKPMFHYRFSTAMEHKEKYGYK